MIYGELKDNYIALEPKGVASTREHAFELKELLKSAGWVVEASSDGTTFDASGDILTGYGSGAGGLGNFNAYFIIRIPSGEFRISFQYIDVSSSNDRFRAKISEAPFSIGGTATKTPSSSEEQLIMGGGTDAAPTGSTWSSHGAAGNQQTIGVAETVYPYRFYVAELRDNVPYAHSGTLVLDAAEVLDSDPWVHVLSIPSSNFGGQLNTSTLGTNGGIESWTIMDYYGPNKSWVDVYLDSDGETEDTPRDVDGNIVMVPAFWARLDSAGVPNGIKGWSSLILWNHTNTGSPTIMQVTVDGNTRELIRLYDAVLPWPSGTTIDVGITWPEEFGAIFRPTSFSPSVVVPPVEPKPIPSIGDGVTAFGVRTEAGRGLA